jgi:hypothetical protein
MVHPCLLFRITLDLIQKLIQFGLTVQLSASPNHCLHVLVPVLLHIIITHNTSATMSWRNLLRRLFQVVHPCLVFRTRHHRILLLIQFGLMVQLSGSPNHCLHALVPTYSIMMLSRRLNHSVHRCKTQGPRLFCRLPWTWFRQPLLLLLRVLLVAYARRPFGVSISRIRFLRLELILLPHGSSFCLPAHIFVYRFVPAFRCSFYCLDLS